MKKLSYLISVMLLYVLASCSGIKNFVIFPQSYKNQWILETGNANIKNNNVYLAFNKKKNYDFKGFTGYSYISGKYYMIKGFIRFSRIVSGKKCCPENNNINSSFISLLYKADQIRIKNNMLYLYKGKILLLKFRKKTRNKI